MRSFRQRPIGWRHESYRHYLAAKGVKTNRYYAKTFLGRLAEGAIEERERYEDLKRRQQAMTAVTAPAFEEARLAQLKKASTAVPEEDVDKAVAEALRRKGPQPYWADVTSQEVSDYIAKAEESRKGGFTPALKLRIGRHISLANVIREKLGEGYEPEEISKIKFKGFTEKEVNDVFRDSKSKSDFHISGVPPGTKVFKQSDQEYYDSSPEPETVDVPSKEVPSKSMKWVPPKSETELRERGIAAGVELREFTKDDAAKLRMAGAKGATRKEAGLMTKAFMRDVPPEMRRRLYVEQIKEMQDNFKKIVAERNKDAGRLSNLQKPVNGIPKPGDKIPGIKDTSTGKVTAFRKRKQK